MPGIVATGVLRPAGAARRRPAYTPAMRYLAIDLGDKRTGLAVGDDVTGMVSPAGVIEQPIGPDGAAVRAAILRAVSDHDPGEIVIGLPLNMDGTEGARAKTVRTFGETLREAIDLPVQYHDERLSSVAADARMARSGRTHKQKKRLRDALAAATILEDYIRTRNDA